MTVKHVRNERKVSNETWCNRDITESLDVVSAEKFLQLPVEGEERRCYQCNRVEDKIAEKFVYTIHELKQMEEWKSHFRLKYVGSDMTEDVEAGLFWHRDSYKGFYFAEDGSIIYCSMIDAYDIDDDIEMRVIDSFTHYTGEHR